jgi:hypothetical protein
MQQAIQFETIVEKGIIHIPERYIDVVPAAVKVTVVPVSETSIKIGAKSKAGLLSDADFSALKIDTKNWRFNREEANERR